MCWWMFPVWSQDYGDNNPRLSPDQQMHNSNVRFAAASGHWLPFVVFTKIYIEPYFR